jgi:hypothetical protein
MFHKRMQIKSVNVARRHTCAVLANRCTSSEPRNVKKWGVDAVFCHLGSEFGEALCKGLGQLICVVLWAIAHARKNS